MKKLMFVCAAMAAASGFCLDAKMVDAAERGNADAQYALGVKYWCGDGVRADFAEAERWFRAAAERGHLDAQKQLALAYGFGVNLPKDEAEAARWWSAAAEQGDPGAQRCLGGCYAKGVGVRKDEAEAAAWYRKSAEQGFPPAQYELGCCYAGGVGVGKDVAKAAMLFRESAEGGCAKAQYELGVLCSKGIGTEKDDAEAANWFRRAAEQVENLAVEEKRKYGLKRIHYESVKPFYELGIRYADGVGVDKDAKEAVRWLLMAAEGEHELGDELYRDVCRRLAGCYMSRGEFATAVRWWCRSIDDFVFYALLIIVLGPLVFLFGRWQGGREKRRERAAK